ncbi:restriction endonuclease subunit S [Corynebacterium sp. AOP34-AQ2-28]|uniref:restriction endonuclease subunit S n=1 Tax=Corynebacterium sp. AOP34-AQ2-28 TaxID=3457689 RepID=UPI0040337AB7
MRKIPLKRLVSRPVVNGLGLSGSENNTDDPRYIRITDMGSDGKLRDEVFASQPRKLIADAWVHSGDILVASVGATVGKSYLHRLEGDFCFAGYLSRVRPNRSKTDPRFLGYWMESHDWWDQVRQRIVGSTIENLSASKIASFSVPLVSLEEQHLIADYLDRETAEIDAMAIELDQAMVLIDERFQAEVERCFDSLDAPHMPLRSQIQSMTTGTSVTAAKFAPAAGEPGVLATSAVFGHELDEAAVKSVDPHEYARLTCPLRVNTLLVSRMNTMNLVGKAVTVDRHLPDVYLPDRLWAVEVEVPRYVYWWTRSQSYREQIRGLAVGASDSMKTLSQQAFRGITLPVPPVPQQDAVAAQLDESAELTGALKAELQEAKVVLEERRAALISAAVTGQVDVTSHGVSAAEQLRDELEVHV